LLSILTIAESEVVVLLFVCFLAARRRFLRQRVVFVEETVAGDVLASTSLDSSAVDPRRAGVAVVTAGRGFFAHEQLAVIPGSWLRRWASRESGPVVSAASIRARVARSEKRKGCVRIAGCGHTLSTFVLVDHNIVLSTTGRATSCVSRRADAALDCLHQLLTLPDRPVAACTSNGLDLLE
jgi:hypothetical protein